MKLSKAEWAICVIAASLLLFSGGYFAGSGSMAQPYTVTAQHQSAPTPSPSPTPTSHVESIKININTASAAELTVLPGIGEKRAADIVAYREKHGDFTRKEDLTEVAGIGEATLKGLAEYITVK
ncbi:MAG: helix-hairpin-helix domain-containing protein [Oscillospiraceae bacterium]